jgi:protein TonB
MIYQEPPKYPEALEKAGKEGIVTVNALINKGGHPVEVKVRKTSGYKEFDQSAVEAGKKNKFKPGIQGGKPVACWVTYKVTFALNDEK